MKSSERKKLYDAQWAKSNRERLNARRRERRAHLGRRASPETVRKQSLRVSEERKDPLLWAKHKLPGLRHRAKKLGIPFNLTKEDLIVPEICPVLGIPLILKGGATGRVNPNNPSVDRIRPSLGYVKGNVRVISLRANHLKSDATIEELNKVLAYMMEFEDE